MCVGIGRFSYESEAKGWRGKRDRIPERFWRIQISETVDVLAALEALDSEHLRR